MARTTPVPPALLRPIEGKLDAGDILGVLGQTPSLLRRMAGGATPAWLRGRRGEGGWTRSDVLAHLLDTEIVMTFRIRKILCEEDPNVSFFDQDRWVVGLRPHRDRSAKRTAERFAALRVDNLALLRAAGPDAMRRTGVHPETGRLTLEDLAARMARHDVNHLKQLSGA